MLDIEDWEVETLRNLAQEIVRLPLLEIPEGASNVRDLSQDDRLVLAPSGRDILDRDHRPFVLPAGQPGQSGGRG